MYAYVYTCMSREDGLCITLTATTSRVVTVANAELLAASNSSNAIFLMLMMFSWITSFSSSFFNFFLLPSE